MTSTPNTGNNTAARIPDDAMERLRARLGMPAPYMNRPWFTQATRDSIHHYSVGYGDDNPLFTDEEYGKSSIWGSMIGAPGFASNIARPYPVELTAEEKAKLKGDPLAGISAYFSGTELEFWNPVVPGDELVVASGLTAVQEKRSEFADHTILTWNGSIFANQNNVPVMLRNFVFVHAERDTARKKGKYAAIERTQYTDEMLAEIDATYGEEAVRGAEPRYWDDVSIGDALPRMVRGPLLVADIIAVHMTDGPGFYGALLSTKLAYKNRQRVPKFYSHNAFGAWDSAQRCHWDDEWARAVGQPYAYDYGRMRDVWATTMITNWAGDNSWLWKYRSSIRKFNYIGDTHWYTGTVVDKLEVDGLPVVQLEIDGRNQRWDTTITVRAEVILPRAGTGRVPLPATPSGGNPMEMLQTLVRR